jgi:hypothetical protein
MAQIAALVLAAIGGAFVSTVLLSQGMLSSPSPDAVKYYLTVAFIAFVNAGLCVSANTADE